MALTATGQKLLDASIGLDHVTDGAKPQFLLRAFPNDPTTGASVTKYAQYGGPSRNTSSTDTPASEHISGRLKSPFNFSQSVWSNGEIQRISDVTVGNIQVILNDGELDSWTKLGWGGAKVDQMVGGHNRNISTFEVLQTFEGKEVSWDEETFRIEVGTLFDAILDKPLIRPKYAGTGGEEGTSDLKGLYKPMTLGGPNYVPLIEVDPINLIYQFTIRVGVGDLLILTGLFDGGVLLTEGSKEQVEAGTADYFTILERGLVVLRQAPTSKLAASVIDGGDPAGSKQGRIIFNLLTVLGGIDSANIDLPLFTTHETDVPYQCGYYAGTEEVTLRDALKTCLEPTSFLCTTTGGKVRIVRIRNVATETATITFDNSIIKRIERLKTKPIARSVRIGSEKTWALHSDSEVLGGSILGSALTKEYRFQEAHANNATSVQPAARDIERKTIFNDLDHTMHEGTLDVERRVRGAWRLHLTENSWDYSIGDVGAVDFDRFDFDESGNRVLETGTDNRVTEAGDQRVREEGTTKNGLIVGIKRDGETKAYSVDVVV